jgi:hypothetical protein
MLHLSLFVEEKVVEEIEHNRLGCHFKAALITMFWEVRGTSSLE